MNPFSFKRKLRISATSPGSTAPYVLRVTDADTGETINGISKIVLTLDACDCNMAEVTYYEMRDNGSVEKSEEGDPIQHTAIVKNVEIDDITAFEIMDQIRREMK